MILGPGRKTDVGDAAWLTELAAHGLLRGSFVPPPAIRELRDLTRARTVVARDRGRQVQQIEKILEDAGIKLSSMLGCTSESMCVGHDQTASHP